MVGLQGCLLPWSAGSPRELTDAVFLSLGRDPVPGLLSLFGAK